MASRMNWDRVRAENHDRIHRNDPVLPIMHSRGCWCGQPLWHSWKGKDEGKPHPR